MTVTDLIYNENKEKVCAKYGQNFTDLFIYELGSKASGNLNYCQNVNISSDDDDTWEKFRSKKSKCEKKRKVGVSTAENVDNLAKALNKLVIGAVRVENKGMSLLRKNKKNCLTCNSCRSLRGSERHQCILCCEHKKYLRKN